jgi:phage terminase large subunit
MEVQRIEIDYEPREQFARYHNRTERWSCIVAHRRAGKTVACINDAIKQAITCPHPEPHIAYLAPYYAQAKDVAWNYLRRFTAPIPGVTTNETELRVDLPNGGRIRLYGADNYERLRGIYLDGVILDEYAQMDPRAWTEVIRPALSDRQGWATFIGTPMGHNAFYEVWERARSETDWYALMLRASETGLLPDTELADARRTMSADEYQQEYECSFDAAVQGAYYATEMARARTEQRITRVPYDRYCPVYTAWDLGFTDSTAIWFVQAVGNEIHVIDYYEADSKPLSHYADVLHEKAKGWGEGFRWADHYFPHDVRANELSSGKSRVQTLAELGIEAQVVPLHNVNDGINATRRIFDRMWFDEERCKRGIEALTLYRRDKDQKTRMLKDRPLHDWPSHGADAMRYFASGWDGNSARPRDNKVDRHRRRLYGRSGGSAMVA